MLNVIQSDHLVAEPLSVGLAARVPARHKKYRRKYVPCIEGEYVVKRRVKKLGQCLGCHRALDVIEGHYLVAKPLAIGLAARIPVSDVIKQPLMRDSW